MLRPAQARMSDIEYLIHQMFGKGPFHTDGKLKLDLPRHSDAGTSVPLTVSMDSPMTADDYVKEIHVFASENPRPRVIAPYFTPACGKAEMSTRIRLDGSQTVSAVGVTSSGDLWRTDRDIGVTFGACSDLGKGPAPEVQHDPQRRVAVGPAAAPGDIVNVRALIQHPMENGFRLDAFNQWVPLRIVETFTVSRDGEQVIRIKLEPAVSTNPYLSFYLRAPENTAQLEFEWVDTTGIVWKSSAELRVGNS